MENQITAQNLIFVEVAGQKRNESDNTLSKWFWAIYLAASDKGGISAMRLSKQIGVSWITASRMLRKIRIVMGHRDSIYRLHDLIEYVELLSRHLIDDALVGGRRI